MPAEQLTELRARLAQRTGGDVLLDRATIAQDGLNDHWEVCFRTATLRVGSPKISDQDQDGNFSIAGTINLLAFRNLAVRITFFHSHDPLDPLDDQVECLIEFDNLPESFDIAASYPDMPGYINYRPDKLAQGRQDSFFKQIKFNRIRLLYSSFDFFALDRARRLGVSDEAISVTPSLPQPPALGGRIAKRGLNLASVVDLRGEFWDELQAHAVTWLDPSGIEVAGLISSADEGATLEIAHILVNEAGEYPALDLGGGVRLGLKQFAMATGLDAFSPSTPGLFLIGQIGAVDGGMEVTVDIPVGYPGFSVSGSFEQGHILTLSEIEQAFGLGDLTGLLPGPPAELGQLGLRSVQASVSLSPLRLDSLTLAIATERSWQIVPDLIAVQPTLVFGMDRSGASAQKSLDIQGSWLLGSTELETYVSTATGQVGAHLAVGQSLDLGAVFEKLLPGVEHPDISVLDLELTGNYKEKTFAFEMEGEWSFDIGGTPIQVSDLTLAAEYDGTRFNGRISGILCLGGWLLNMHVEMQERLSIEVVIPELDVSEIAEELLHAVRLPAELPKFSLENLDVALTPKSKEYSVSGTSPSVIDLFDGVFAIQMRSFSAARQKGQTSARIETMLRFGSTEVVVSAGYLASDAAKSNGELVPAPEWRFETDMPTDGIPIGHLLAQFADGLGFAYPLPVENVELHKLHLAFNLGAAERYLVLSAALVSRDGGDAKELGAFSLLAERKPENAAADAKASWDYALTVALNLDIDLAQLPLAGPELAAVQEMRLHAAVCTIAKRDYTQQEMSRQIARLPQNAVQPVAKPIAKGANFAVDLMMGGSPSTYSVPVSADKPSPAKPSFVPPDPITQYAPAAAVDQTKWFPIHKDFRSLRFQRIGLRFQNAQVTFLLDAAIKLGPIDLGLLGLGVSSPLTRFVPSFSLDGLSLGFAAGPLSISGGFLRQPSDKAFYGQARVDAKAFNLTALGSYGEVDGHTSLFLFALLEQPLGGPPYFFVRGLAFGFGYNSRLNLPTVDQLPNFSLVRAVLPGKSLSNDPLKPAPNPNDPTAVLRAMANDITAAPGELWIAAGVRFSTFEQVQSFALVTISTQGGLRVDLLGLSQISIPSNVPNPIAYAEIAIKATFDPAAGLMAVEGRLTPSSYVLDRACQLTGGFAFYTWFSGRYEGDFVLTLGGYHPRFKAPAHYPVVPRLALNWQVSSNLSIKGSAYFAITPQAVMAGGALAAVWESGDLRAWFVMNSDFLIYWKPFHYDIDISISIGVSVKLDLLVTSVTLTFSLGVGLSLYGPDFGGEARIDLAVISFTIGFGADRPALSPLSWQEFKESFLPPPNSAQALAASAIATPPPVGITPTNTICGVVLAAGVVRDLTKQGSPGGLQYVVDPDRVVLRTNTAVPATRARLNARELNPAEHSWNSQISVGPSAIGSESFTSLHDVRLEQRDGDVYAPAEIALSPVLRNVPRALWAPRGGAMLDGRNQVVAGALVGFELAPRRPPPDMMPPIEIAKLGFAPPELRDFVWSSPTLPPANAFAREVTGATMSYALPDGRRVETAGYVLSGIDDGASRARRSPLLAAMRAGGLPVAEAVDLAPMAATVLTDWPLVGRLGQEVS